MRPRGVQLDARQWGASRYTGNDIRVIHVSPVAYGSGDRARSTMRKGDLRKQTERDDWSKVFSMIFIQISAIQLRPRPLLRFLFATST